MMTVALRAAAIVAALVILGSFVAAGLLVYAVWQARAERRRERRDARAARRAGRTGWTPDDGLPPWGRG